MSYTPPSSLIFWLKADADVYKDNGTPPTACANNESVYLWKDQTSNHSDVIQGTSGLRPVYKTAIINGLPGILFTESSSQYLETSGSIAHGLGSGKFLLAAVYSNVGTDGLGAVFSIGAYSPVLYVSNGTSTRELRFYLSSGVNFTDAVVANSTTYLSLCGRTDTGGTINAWHAEIGSTPVVSSVTGADTGSIATNPFFVGWDDYESSTNYLNGYLHELMLFDSSYTTQHKTDVINYLNDKYAGTSAPTTSSASILDL